MSVSQLCTDIENNQVVAIEFLIVNLDHCITNNECNAKARFLYPICKCNKLEIYMENIL